MLTYERLHELLDYNSETGIFNWKISKGSVKVGSVAGCQRKNGYVGIRVDGESYLAHRLAWLYVYGHFSENGIDHINQVRNHNPIKNLREVSRSCNIRNGKPFYKNNTSGIKGVYWHKPSKKWRARIMINGKNIYLGIFINKLDAAIARHDAEIKYRWSVCSTKASSAYNYIQKCG